jgi:hypothetical protein
MATDPKVIASRKIAAEQLLEGGEQLSMFGEGGATVPAAERSGPGRPPGAQNKLKVKLGQYLAQKGYRDPAEQLAMLAGLDRPDVHPLAYAAEIARLLGEDVMAVARERRQAADALMPYWHPKLTPDTVIKADRVGILMAGPGGLQLAGEGGAQDPFAPADVRFALDRKDEENQEVDGEASDVSDAEARTE